MRGDTTLLQSRIKLIFTNVTESNLSINFKNFHFQSVTSVKLYLISTVTVNFRIIIKIYLQQANMTIYSLNNTLLFYNFLVYSMHDFELNKMQFKRTQIYPLFGHRKRSRRSSRKMSR